MLLYKYMAKERVNFLATKYKNEQVTVSFFTKKGQPVSFEAVKKVPHHEQVRFVANVKKGKK